MITIAPKSSIITSVKILLKKLLLPNKDKTPIEKRHC